MKHLIIVASGGMGRTVYSMAKECIGYGETFDIKGFIDDNLHALDGFENYPSILGTIKEHQPQDGEVFVSPDEILYLESVDDRVFAYTDDWVLRIDGSLNTFTNELGDERFFRCSKSMIINVNRVIALKSLSSNRIDATMEGGEHIMISRRYTVDFRRLLKGDR